MKKKLGIIVIIMGLYSSMLYANENTVITLAEQGDADAQLIVGYMYLSGSNGVERDEEKAKYWIKKAAEQKDADAEAVLGTLYYAEKDNKLATYWLERACMQANEQACVLLNKIE